MSAGTVYTRAEVRRWLTLLGLGTARLPRAGRALIVSNPIAYGPSWIVKKAGAGYTVAALEPVQPSAAALEALADTVDPYGRL